MSNTRLDLTSEIQDLARQSAMNTLQAVKKAWEDEANNRLKTTAKDYTKGIKAKYNMSSNSGEVYLEGTWANKLEQGFPSFDMKPYFAVSSKRHISKQGGQWYLYIPFKYTTPASTGRSAPRMPASVYKAARSLPKWGRLTSSKGSGESFGNFEGLQKVPESPTSSRSSYKTWRTVSSNSPSSAFIHPGFKGVHIADDLVPQIQDTFLKVFMQDNN